MKLVRKGKISFLQPVWGQSGPFIAGFTTRNGGVSRPPFNSLNLAYNTDDARHNVDGNRSNLARAFDLPPHLILTVKQVHGDDILILDEPNPDLTHFLSVECDAVLTNQPQIMIGVLVADCFPILLADPVKKVVAAVHAGWRGAASGIISKTVKAMEASFGCDPKGLSAAVGPGIGSHLYEVDRPVRDAFREGTGYWDDISEEVGLGKWRLDIGKSCRLQLEGAGLSSSNIDIAEECTCCHKELFFSYRRDKGNTGRQLGFVMIR